MSVVRSPRLESIRRKEDEADRKKVSVIVGGICVAIALLFVGAVTLKVIP